MTLTATKGEKLGSDEPEDEAVEVDIGEENGKKEVVNVERNLHLPQCSRTKQINSKRFHQTEVSVEGVANALESLVCIDHCLSLPPLLFHQEK